MADLKNQHFLQKAYLDGFAATDVPDHWRKTTAIWVLNKDTGVISLHSTQNTAARSYYYSFMDRTGAMNPTIEKWFNPVENQFVRIRQHIRDHIEEVNLTGQASNLDPKYKRSLAEYVYIHIIRVPKIFDDIRRQAETYERETAQKHGVQPDPNMAKVLALRTMIRIGQSPGMNIVDSLMSRCLDVEFYPRTKVSLPTSDTPVMMYDETRGAGLAYGSTTVFFPLESSIMLRFAEFGDNAKLVKQRYVGMARPLPQLVGAHAQKEIYCRDPHVLEEVATFLGLKTTLRDPRPPKLQTS